MNYTGSRDPAIHVAHSGIAILDFTRIEMERMLQDVQRHFPIHASTLDETSTQTSFFEAAETVHDLLGDRASMVLSSLRQGFLDAAVFRGFEVEGYGFGGRKASPSLGYSWLGLLARQLGHEYSYQNEKNGALIHDVVPTRDAIGSQSNASSATQLALHTDIAFHNIRPDFIILCCLRAGEEPASTRLVRLDDVLEQLQTRDLQVLREPRFEIHPPESFLLEGTPDEARLIAPLGGSLRRRTIRWHGSLRGVDGAACSARRAFLAAASDVTVKVALHAGDILVFSNDRCLHGRDAFAARFNGRDRWLLRSYVRRDIRQLPALPNTAGFSVVADSRPGRSA